MSDGPARHKTTFLTLAALIVIWAILGTFDVRNLTYTGYLTDGDNTVVQVTSGSPAEAAGLRVGDYIRSIGGISVEDTKAQFRQPRPAVGEVRTYVVERDGASVSLDVQNAALPGSQKAVTFVAALVGLAFLVCGLWAYLTAPSPATALLALLGLCFAPALLTSPYFASSALRAVQGSVITTVVLLGFAVLMHFLLSFPERRTFLARPNAAAIMYAPAAVVALTLVVFLVLQPAATSGVNVFFRMLFGLFIAGYFGVSLVALIRSYAKAGVQARAAHGLTLMLLGAVLGLGLLLISALVGLVLPRVVLPGQQYYFLALVLIPITFAAAAVRSARAGAPRAA